MSENPVRCDNCGRRSDVACATCNRDICYDCFHCGETGKVCGLCKDREDGYKEWQRLGEPWGDFERWYDVNG